MRRVTPTLSLSAVGLCLSLGAGTAFAGTGVVNDPSMDALAITSSGVTVGDFDIDLRTVNIDHGTRSLQITSTFTYTDANSWNNLNALIDTNGDGIGDYTVLWSKDGGVAGVLDAAETVTCTSIGTGEKFGVNGTVTMTIPRTCIGNPASVAVHVDVFWFGTNTSGADLSFVDSAPGLFIDEPALFSARVPSSNTGTATSPQAPAPIPTKTKVTVKLSKKSQTVGKSPAIIRIRVSGDPAGQVTVADNGKAVKRLPVKPGKELRFVLPRNLKPGGHRISVTFVPKDKTAYSASSQTVKLRVARR